MDHSPTIADFQKAIGTWIDQDLPGFDAAWRVPFPPWLGYCRAVRCEFVRDELDWLEKFLALAPSRQQEIARFFLDRNSARREPDNLVDQLQQLASGLIQSVYAARMLVARENFAPIALDAIRCFSNVWPIAEDFPELRDRVTLNNPPRSTEALYALTDHAEFDAAVACKAVNASGWLMFGRLLAYVLGEEEPTAAAPATCPGAAICFSARSRCGLAVCD